MNPAAPEFIPNETWPWPWLRALRRLELEAAERIQRSWRSWRSRKAMKRRKGTETATKRAAAPRTRRRRHSQQPRDTLTQSWEAWSSWDADDRLQWWTGGRQARWVPKNREDEPEGWKWKSDHRNQGVADACPTSVRSVRGRSEPPPSRRSRGRTFEGDVYKECWEKSRGSTAVWRKKSEAPIRPIASTSGKPKGNGRNGRNGQQGKLKGRLGKVEPR
ncbi:unnamed protein product [Cladocopium goreaui]|uniref:Uncharacterized protein n=1 Tax=Cladocopium goreaui TaxID=2562237 RepID=A0A9P1CN93_9DINO|nr:unnamed protein product [Cladocopium goreaui]